MTRREQVPSARWATDRRGFLATVGIGAAGAAAAPFLGSALPASAATAALSPRAARFSVPAEDVRHARTWMAFPDGVKIWGRALPGVQEDIARIAATIAEYEPVFLCANAKSAARARSLCGSGVTVLTDIPVDDCWIRDTGAVFRLDGSGNMDAIGLNFNGWGNKQAHANDAKVAARIADHAGVAFAFADVVGEGGAIEQDGAGTLMATRSSLVNSNRNPGMSEGDVEDAILDAYGANAMIWFDGVKGQDITDDHVDATSRFAASGRAVVQVPHAADNDAFAKDARRQFAALSSASTADGAPIEVTSLQGPDYDRIRSANRDFLASYANFYVCNDAVIMGQFGDTKADAAAKATLAALFPGRTIEQLDIDHLGTGGGGIHCVTQQQPEQ